MIFKRRDFIISAGLMAVATILPKMTSGKTVFLGKKSYCIVGPDTLLKLPENPSKGHCVNLIIPHKSVERPSRIQFNSAPLLGDKEDLVLDSFGHIRLTYLNSKEGWRIIPPKLS